MRDKTLKTLKSLCLIICELFVVFTAVLMINAKDYFNVLTCLMTVVLVLLPLIVEKLFGCKINLTAYIFISLYTLGPMMGDCYKLYYITSWWDKLLHTAGGIIFALFALYLFNILCPDNKKLIATAIFAFCFSVTISVLWEFFEFGSDLFFGTDMQHDTVLNSVCSYLLGDKAGISGTIENIKSVTINGEILPVNGYIDVGLVDSMTDMLFETLGAFAVSLGYVLDKGKHTAFVRNK